MSHWSGNVNFESKYGRLLDFSIQHKKVPSYIFDSLDAFLGVLYSVDSRLNIYLHKMKKKNREITPDEIYRLITEEYRDDRYGNIRGGSSEYISGKVIEKNLLGLGNIMKIEVMPPAIVVNGNVAYLMDAASREIDMVVSCPSREEFHTFFRNLKADDNLALSFNSASDISALFDELLN